MTHAFEKLLYNLVFHYSLLPVHSLLLIICWLIFISIKLQVTNVGELPARQLCNVVGVEYFLTG